MSLANYTDLQASVAAWANRTDLAAVIPDFVTLTEARIGRDLRTRNQLIVGTLTTTANVRSVALPADWLEFENVSIAGTPETPCQYVNVEHMDVKYPDQGASAKPYVYTIEGANILFGPLPDAVYTVNIMYYARYPALATSGTNWLLTNHPGAYLYGCLREVALFLKDDGRVGHWDGLYQAAIKQVQDVDDRATHSGTVLRVKAI